MFTKHVKSPFRPTAVLESVEVRRLLSTVIVNTLADETIANSTTSLREAIVMANAGDTVQFKAGLSGQITLGGSQLLIDKSLTLSGPGAATLKVSGNDASRVFEIGASASVSMSGLTITKGHAEGDGGGIYNAGALALNQCVVSNNSVVGIDGELGDPDVPGSMDRLDGGAARGGGIYNIGTLTLTATTLSGNTVVGGDGVFRELPWTVLGGIGGAGQGGAIYGAQDGAITLIKSVVSGNTATGGVGGEASGGTGAGGGVYHVGDGALTVTDSTLAGNKAVGGTVDGYIWMETTGGVAQGGAIYNSSGTLAITGSSLFGNAAVGGTDESDSTAGPGGNAAGGAVYSLAAASISKTSFSDNAATGGSSVATGDNPHDSMASEPGNARGGAIEAFADLTLANCTLSDNRATGGNGQGAVGIVDLPSAAFGGAIAGHGTTVITKSTFSNNAAMAGIFEHSAPASGGAILQSEGTLRITDSTLAGNKAVASDAGPAWSLLEMAGAPADGGAIFATFVSITGSTLSGNTAAASAGGEGIEYGPGAAGGTASGGAIALAPGGTASLARSTLSGNVAVGGDGGSQPEYERGGQGGDARGGGIYAPGSLTLTAVTVAGNAAIGGAAGGVGAIGGEGFGGGVSAAASRDSLLFANTVIATNTADTGPDVSGAVTSQGFNLIGKRDGSTGWVGSDQSGTVAAPLNPLLAALGSYGGPTQTMPPMNSSPAIDAGKAFGLTTDQRGQTRTLDFAALANPVGGDGTDIGAVELQTFPGLPQTPFKNITIGATAVTIQAEDFDNGGEASAYHDAEARNLGGAYRSTGVDVQATTDTGGGYNVGWTKAGEWLEYTVNVQTAALYDFAFRFASPAGGGRFHLEVDGQNVTGALAVPTTGAWQKFTTITKSRVRLEIGTHVLRVALDKVASNGFAGNFNYLKVSPSLATVTTDSAAHVRDGPYRGANYGTSPTLEVKKSSVGYNRETYIKFDLASVPATLLSAKLRLYAKLLSSENPSMALTVDDAYLSWTESTLTWNNRPQVDQHVGGFTVTGTAAKWYEVDVKSYLQAAKNSGRQSVTFVIRSTQATNAVCGFNSDEAASNAPQLVIWS